MECQALLLEPQALLVKELDIYLGTILLGYIYHHELATCPSYGDIPTTATALGATREKKCPHRL